MKQRGMVNSLIVSVRSLLCRRNNIVLIIIMLKFVCYVFCYNIQRDWDLPRKVAPEIHSCCPLKNNQKSTSSLHVAVLIKFD